MKILLANNMHSRQISLTVSLLFLACLLGSCAIPPRIQYQRSSTVASDSFEMRPSALEPTASMRLATWRKQRQHTYNVYVSDSPILSARDIKGASVTVCPNGYGVEVFLYPEASFRLQQFSAENIGKQLAILISNEVDSVTLIYSEIISPTFLLCDPFSSEEKANELAKLISGR
ncbi:MAG: hypothetical protein Q7J75_01825 [Rhodoferax sp.]|nr:hypothetical protein [Rhodoferax sp.]